MIEQEALILGLALAAGVAIANLLAAPALAFVFPQFTGATNATIATAIACVPLGIVAWLLPILIPLSSKPWHHAAFLFAPSFLVLIFAMNTGNEYGGINGQAWGTVAAALILMVNLVILFFRMNIVTGLVAVRMILLQFLFVALLTATAIANDFRSSSVQAVFNPEPIENQGPPVGWKLAFQDEFTSLRLWDRQKTGIWEPHYPWGDQTNASNKELQHYVDPRPAKDNRALLPLHPYSIENNQLVISARPVPRHLQKHTRGLKYASGLLTTYHSFSCTYCYVEMRARVPRGKGLWPAFWMLPINQSWPPRNRYNGSSGGANHKLLYDGPHT